MPPRSTDNTQTPNQNQPQQTTQSDATLSAMQKYKSIQDKILQTEQEIANLRSRTPSSLIEQLRIETDINERQRRRLTELQELRDTEREISSILDDEENTEKSILDIVEKRRSNQSEVKDLTQSVLSSMREQKYEIMEISDVGRKVTENMKATSGFATSFGNILQQVNNELDGGANFSNQFLDTLQETNNVREEYRNLEREIADGAKEAAQGKYDGKKVEEDLAKKTTKLRIDEESYQDKTKEFLKNMQNMTWEQIRDKQTELDLEREALNSRQVSLDAMTEQNKLMGETSKTAEKTLGVLDKITSGDFKGALLQKFGLDDINSQLKEKVGGALVNTVKAFKAGDLKGAISEAGKGIKGILDMAGKLTMALGIGALFMLGKFLLDSFGKLDKEVSQLGKDFGISKNEAKELHHAAVDVANEMKVTGIHSEEIAKSLKTVSDNLGGADIAGKFAAGDEKIVQMVKDTALLTEKFGMSGEEVAGMNKNAAILGMSVGEASQMAVTLGDGIYNAKDSMKILSGIPANIVSSMKSMPKALMNTAIQAKLLGMDMQKIADIGRKSLDIESSLEAEMEARVLTGKNINLDKMRAAALDGDQETVMKELLNAAGSMDDFNKMNVIQKEALAKAAGMEVEEMAKMLGKQEELNKAGLSQKQLQELQKENASTLAGIAASTADKDKKAFLEKLAADKKSEENAAAFQSLMKRIQEVAVKLLDPILDMVDGLMQGGDGAAAMDGILNGVKGTVSVIKPIIGAIAATIGYIIKPLTWILGLFGDSQEQTQQIAQTTGKVGDSVQEVTNQVKPLTAGFGNVLTAVTAIGGFFAGKAILGKGLDMLKSKASDLGSTIMSKVGGPLGKIGGKLFGGGKKEEAGGAGGIGGAGDKASVGEAEKGKNMVSGILDKMKSIIDSIKGVVQSAIGFVRDVGKDLLATLNDVVKGIGDILKTGADIVVNVGTKLAEGAMKILNIIMKGLAQAAATLPGIMASLGSAVVAFFTPMAALIAPPVLLGIAVFTAAMIGLGFAFKMLGEGIGAAAPGITAFFDGVGTVVQAVGEAIANVIETITTSVIRLQDIDGGKLLTTAAGIVAIGGAIAALGAGKAAEGFGSFVGKLFGGGDDPFEKLIGFSDRMNPEKLVSTANGLKVLGDVFKSVADSVNLLASSLDKIDLSKMDSALEKLKEAKELTDMSVGEGIAAAAESFVGGITNIFGSSEEQKTQSVSAGTTVISGAGGGTDNSMAKVEQKLDTLINVLSAATSTPTVIKFGDKVVDEIKTQLNFRKAYTGTDIAYGKTLGN
jgi:hypothetical protein